MSLRSDFISMDDRLAAHGVPPLTGWWRQGVGDWLDAYELGDCLELVACAGRGSAKSTVIYKLAAFFSLFGLFTIPIGERHYAIVLSRLKEEAQKAPGIISAWLALLGVPHRVAGDVIELTDALRGIRVVAASVAATSGWRAYFVGKDERSKWPSEGVSDLDAEEIDTSSSAMTATHDRAPVVTGGSAWGNFGPFFEAVTGGSDARRHILGPVPTWVAAPHISEESTRRKERNPARWAREYACIFQDGAASAFASEEIDAAIRELPAGCEVVSTPVIVTDASAGRGDSWTWCAVSWVREPSDTTPMLMLDLIERAGQRILVTRDDRQPGDVLLHGRATVARDPLTHEPIPDATYRESNGLRLAVSSISALDGKFAEQGVGSGDVVRSIAATAKRFKTRKVYGDQFSQFALAESFSRNGLAYMSVPWTNELKVQAVTHLRTWLRDRTIIIAPGPEAQKLKTELLRFEERLLPSGYTAYGARRGGHDDRVALLLLTAALDVMSAFSGSPSGINRKRYETR